MTEPRFSALTTYAGVLARLADHLGTGVQRVLDRDPALETIPAGQVVASQP
jgi:hypothetical protein